MVSSKTVTLSPLLLFVSILSVISLALSARELGLLIGVSPYFYEDSGYDDSDNDPLAEVLAGTAISIVFSFIVMIYAGILSQYAIARIDHTSVFKGKTRRYGTRLLVVAIIQCVANITDIALLASNRVTGGTGIGGGACGLIAGLSGAAVGYYMTRDNGAEESPSTVNSQAHTDMAHPSHQTVPVAAHLPAPQMQQLPTSHTQPAPDTAGPISHAQVIQVNGQTYVAVQPI